MKRKILIIGAGFSGATFARMAVDKGHSAHIVDQKDHIGGNSYSYKDQETGIEIHKYGPHIFHTDSEQVYKFVTRFTKLNNYINRVKAVSSGQVYSLPINLHTINQFFGKNFSPEEAETFIKNKRIKFEKINNFEEHVLNSIGRELYEAFFRDYTIKHWGKMPHEIPVSTAKRLPLRFNYNDNYFDDKYQGIPIEGYGKLFDKMTNHKNIKISLCYQFDSIKSNWREKYDCLVYTGSIDSYFNFDFGHLLYRTVHFEEIRGKEIQGNAVMNYCDMNEPYARIHEHKYFTPEKEFSTSVAYKEFSEVADSSHNPYYPVITPESINQLEKYKKLAQMEKDVVFIGRLGMFQYLNMDQAIENAMVEFRRVIK